MDELKRNLVHNIVSSACNGASVDLLNFQNIFGYLEVLYMFVVIKLKSKLYEVHFKVKEKLTIAHVMSRQAPKV